MISSVNKLLKSVGSTHLHGSVDLLLGVDDGVATGIGVAGHDELGDCIVWLAPVV